MKKEHIKLMILAMVASIFLIACATDSSATKEIEELNNRIEELEGQLMILENETNVMNDSSSENLYINDKTSEGAIASFTFISDGVINSFLGEGTYRVGTDIEAGNYYAYGFSGHGYFKVFNNITEQDTVQGENVILRFITLSEGEFIEVSNGTIIFQENELNENALYDYGIFQVGRDIPAGEYRAISFGSSHYIGELAYSSWSFSAYEIFNYSYKSTSLTKNNSFGEQAWISLEDGQYIILVDVSLYQ